MVNGNPPLANANTLLANVNTLLANVNTLLANVNAPPNADMPYINIPIHTDTVCRVSYPY